MAAIIHDLIVEFSYLSTLKVGEFGTKPQSTDPHCGGNYIVAEITQIARFAKARYFADRSIRKNPRADA